MLMYLKNLLGTTKSYNEFPKRIDVKLSQKFCEIKGIGTTLFTSFIKYINKLKLSYRDKAIYISINKEPGWVNVLLDVLKNASKIYKSKKAVMFVDEN